MPFREESMSTNQPAQEGAAAAGGEGGAPDARQLRTILIAVSIALMAVIASVSGLNVAQTHMAVEFGASQNTVLWIINIYTLALAALLLPLGAIGDRLGRKPMLIAGLGIFGVAHVVAGLAPTAQVMIAARVASGVGAAMIMPRLAAGPCGQAWSSWAPCSSTSPCAARRTPPSWR
jgi:MFS family permease